jgi:hypothetical protein
MVVRVLGIKEKSLVAAISINSIIFKIMVFYILKLNNCSPSILNVFLPPNYFVNLIGLYLSAFFIKKQTRYSQVLLDHQLLQLQHHFDLALLRMQDLLRLSV